MTIDTNVILSLFKNKGESTMNKKTKTHKNYIWDKIFKTNKKAMKMNGYEFKTLLTDGIGVCICFQKVGRKYQEFSGYKSLISHRTSWYFKQNKSSEYVKFNICSWIVLFLEMYSYNNLLCVFKKNKE